ncbi:hypothetical protein BDK88_3298 [Natrinema hispanicum]|uniref:Uncharacterized protein n=1 Tax=Natrinema hispanicum TaxID=392421 RepID=A0A482YA31_9EURY|nr:hypothetical protein BDK88_3298 [Natrinema hispanicum]
MPSRCFSARETLVTRLAGNSDTVAVSDGSSFEYPLLPFGKDDSSGLVD